MHDFGALVVSLRNRGQTVGEIAGRMISRRTKVLFLLILFFALTVVLAVFGLVIASIFSIYPQTVLPVWISLPIAIVIGLWVYRGGGQPADPFADRAGAGLRRGVHRRADTCRCD